MNKCADRRAVAAGLLTCLLAIAGCSRQAEPAPPQAEAPQAGTLKPKAPKAPTPQPPVAATVAEAPGEEPSEPELREYTFREYEAIERAGGMPVHLTQTGQNFVIFPKLYEVHKEKCISADHVVKGSWECHLRIVLSLNGGDPGEQGERTFVKRGPNGDLIAQ